MSARRQTVPMTAGLDGGPGGGAPIGELDRVRLLASVIGDCDERVPMGSTGTVVAIYPGGTVLEVEFTQPVDALATVEARSLLVVERAEG